MTQDTRALAERLEYAAVTCAEAGVDDCEWRLASDLFREAAAALRTQDGWKEYARLAMTHLAGNDDPDAVAAHTILRSLLRGELTSAGPPPSHSGEREVLRKLVEWHDTRYTKNLGEPFAEIIHAARALASGVPHASAPAPAAGAEKRQSDKVLEDLRKMHDWFTKRGYTGDAAVVENAAWAIEALETDLALARPAAAPAEKCGWVDTNGSCQHPVCGCRPAAAPADPSEAREAYRRAGKPTHMDTRIYGARPAAADGEVRARVIAECARVAYETLLDRSENAPPVQAQIADRIRALAARPTPRACPHDDWTPTGPERPSEHGWIEREWCCENCGVIVTERIHPTARP